MMDHHARLARIVASRSQLHLSNGQGGTQVPTFNTRDLHLEKSFKISQSGDKIKKVSMLIATADLNPSQAIVDHHCVVKPEDISRWLREVPAKAVLSTLKRLAASCSIVQNLKKYEEEQKKILPYNTDQMHLRANAKDLFLASHYSRKCLFTRNSLTIKSLSNVYF